MVSQNILLALTSYFAVILAQKGGAPPGVATSPKEAKEAKAPETAAAKCARATLTQVRDDFWKSAMSGSQPKLASGAKIALNNKVTSLAGTPFGQIKGSTWTPFLAQALDTEICEIATFRVSSQQLLSTRLKLNSAGAISEVEFLQAVKGDQFFRPTGFPNTVPAIFNQKQTATAPPVIPTQWTPAGGMFDNKSAVNKSTCKALRGAPRAWTRRELIYAANSYCDGLKGPPFDSCVFSGRSCPRNENGVTTTQNCGVGTGKFKFTTRGRRWVADTETGVVLGAFYFDYGPGKNLFLHEYFKVKDGALAYIFAPMKNIPHAQASAKTFAEETR